MLRIPKAAFAGLLLLLLSVPVIAHAQGTNAPKRTGFVVTGDGARLYYHIVGTGKPVVIAPGRLFLERDFTRLARNRTIVFYDMRGRGRSSAVHDSSRVSLDFDVSDLEAVRRHVGAEKFVPLGWSYLGMMVMRYAAAHPERVERIVQLGPLGRAFRTPYPDSLMGRDAPAVVDAVLSAKMKEQRENGLAEREPRKYCELDYLANRASLVGNQANAARVPNMCSMPNEYPSNLGRHFQWLFTSFAMGSTPGWDAFATVTVPVLTIHGTWDRNAPYGGGREWASHLPEGRLLAVPRASHMLWLDAPGVVYPALEQFLSGRWPAGAVHPAPLT